MSPNMLSHQLYPTLWFLLLLSALERAGAFLRSGRFLTDSRYFVHTNIKHDYGESLSRGSSRKGIQQASHSCIGLRNGHQRIRVGTMMTAAKACEAVSQNPISSSVSGTAVTASLSSSLRTVSPPSLPSVSQSTKLQSLRQSTTAVEAVNAVKTLAEKRDIVLSNAEIESIPQLMIYYLTIAENEVKDRFERKGRDQRYKTYLSSYLLADCAWGTGTLQTEKLRRKSSDSAQLKNDRKRIADIIQDEKYTHRNYTATTFQTENDLYLTELAVKIITNLVLQEEKIKGRDIAKTMIGFSKMGVIWENITPHELGAVLSKNMNNLDARGLSNVLWSLGNLYVHFDQLSVLLKSLIFDRMLLVSPEWTDQGLGSSLWGLQKMGLKWEKLPIEVRSSISATICRVCFKMSPQALGNTLYALGTLGARSEGVSDRMTMAIEMAVRKSASKMTKKDSMQVLQGLSLMEFSWSEISEGTQSSISIAVFKQAVNWSAGGPIYAVEISTLLHALSKMNVLYEQFDAPLRAAILTGVIALCDVERLEDLERSKKEVLREKEKMKYGALTSRRKESWYPNLTPVSSSYEEESAGEGALNKINDGISMSGVGGEDEKLSLRLKSGLGATEVDVDVVGDTRGERLTAVESDAIETMRIDRRDGQDEEEATLSQPPASLPAEGHQPLLSSSSSTSLFSSSPPSTSSPTSELQYHAPVPSVSASLAWSISSLLHSLSELGLTFQTLPSEGRDSIWRGVVTFAKDFTPQALSMTILGLSGMKVSWIDDVPTNVREALFSSISENIKYTIENKYSMNRGKNVRKMMVDSKYLMTFQSVSNILYGLSSMGLRWGAMGADSRNLLSTLISCMLQSHLKEDSKMSSNRESTDEKKSYATDWKNAKRKRNENKNTESASNYLDQTSESLTIQDFRFLLNSMAAIRFEFTESNHLDISSSSSSFPSQSPTPLKNEEMLKLVLDSFIQVLFTSNDINADIDTPSPLTLSSVTEGGEEGSSDRTEEGMLSSDFFSMLQSLGTVNFKFEDLENAVKIRNILNFNGNPNNQKSFPDLFNSFINEDSLEDVSSALKSLVRMRCTWSEINQRTKTTILKIIMREKKNMTSRLFFSIFNSLSLLGLKQIDMNSKEILNGDLLDRRAESEGEIKINKMTSNSGEEHYNIGNETVNSDFELLRELFLTDLDRFVLSLKSKQTYALLNTMTTLRIELIHINLKTRNIMLFRVLRSLENISPSALQQTLSGLAKTDIFNSGTLQSTESLSQKKRKDDEDIRNKASDDLDNENVLTNDILLRKIRKSVIDAVINLSESFDGNEAQPVIRNLAVLDLMKEFDGTVLNKMYSSMLSGEIPPSPPPFVSVSSPSSSSSSPSFFSSSSSSSSRVSKGLITESGDDDDETVNLDAGRLVEGLHTQHNSTNSNDAHAPNVKYVRTDSTVSGRLSPYELVRALGASGAKWRELSAVNQNALVDSLEKMQNRQYLEKDKTRLISSLLKNLNLIKMPWFDIPTSAQFEIIEFARLLYTDNHSMSDIFENDFSKNKISSLQMSSDKIKNKNAISAKGDSGLKASDVTKNKYNVNNIKTETSNALNTSKPNKNNVLQSIGLDTLAAISNLGCTWGGISRISTLTSNILLYNSCNIILKSQTKISTYVNNEEYEYSDALKTRNDRLVTYGSTFAATFKNLNVNFDDMYYSSEKIVLRSIIIILDAVVNKNVMDYGKNRNVYATLERDTVDSETRNKGVENENKRDIVNEEEDVNEDKMGLTHGADIQYSTNSVDSDVTGAGTRTTQTQSDSNVNYEIDVENENVDIRLEENSKANVCTNIGSVQKELEMLENMNKIKEQSESVVTEIGPDPSILADKKQADEDFFLEIESVSKSPKKLRSSVSVEKKNMRKNGVLYSKEKKSAVENDDESDTSPSSSPSPVSPSTQFSSPPLTPPTPPIISPLSTSPPTSPSHDTSKSTISLGSINADPPNNGPLNIHQLFHSFFSSGITWRKISSKNKSDFSNNLNEILSKLEKAVHSSAGMISQEMEIESNKLPPNNEKNSIASIYLNKNKKYFHFLEIRMSLFSVIRKYSIDQPNTTYKLKENIRLFENDVRAVIDDCQYVLANTALDEDEENTDSGSIRLRSIIDELKTISF